MHTPAMRRAATRGASPRRERTREAVEFKGRDESAPAASRLLSIRAGTSLHDGAEEDADDVRVVLHNLRIKIQVLLEFLS